MTAAWNILLVKAGWGVAWDEARWGTSGPDELYKNNDLEVGSQVISRLGRATGMKILGTKLMILQIIPTKLEVLKKSAEAFIQETGKV